MTAGRPRARRSRKDRLPKPEVQAVSRSRRRLPCPRCRRSCYRDTLGRRRLRDVGSRAAGRPRVLEATYSVHRCESCRIYFSADLSDLAPARGLYTRRVRALALRAVLVDGLSYPAASRRLRREHLVAVPWATIQNWAEAARESDAVLPSPE